MCTSISSGIWSSGLRNRTEHAPLDYQLSRSRTGFFCYINLFFKVVMKNCTPRIRTTNWPIAKHLSSSVHHQLVSCTIFILVLFMPILRGQDEKQISQDLSYRHTSSANRVFPTTSSALATREYVFLFYFYLFFKVIMKNTSPGIRTSLSPVMRPSSSPLDHQLWTFHLLFF